MGSGNSLGNAATMGRIAGTSAVADPSSTSNRSPISEGATT
jgi:hypothetical protein